MNRLGWMGLGVLLAGMTAAQCGFPDFNFSGTGGQGTGASGSGASGSGGSGEAGPSTSSSSSSSSSTSTSSGGTGGGTPCAVKHPGGGTCEYLPGFECGCSGDMKCSVIDETTGASGCVFSGTTPSYSHCTVDSDCAAGAWCNHSTQACQPICVNTADCSAEGGQCEQALQSGGTAAIPGLNVCAAHCDLVTAMPCGSGLNCVYDSTSNEFECVLSKSGRKHAPCTTDSDCEATFACVDDGFGTYQCLAWCTPPSSTGNFGVQGCPNGYCDALNTPVQKGAVSYGICSN